MGAYASFLYAEPSFWEGMARILDFSGILSEYNQSHSPEQADAMALRMDWLAVGAELRRAVAIYEERIPGEQAPA